MSSSSSGTPDPGHHRTPGRDGPGSGHYDPWTAPGAGDRAGPSPTPRGAGDPTGTPADHRAGAVRGELREGAVVAATVPVAGVLLGLLWLWLAPRVPLVVGDDAVLLKDSEGEQAVGADGTFVLLALGVGALVGTAVFWLRRRGGLGVVFGLLVGSVLGSVLAWRLGVWLGPPQDVVAHARSLEAGTVFEAPLELRAKGALLAWPLGAVLAHLVFTGVFQPRDPEPGEPTAPYGNLPKAF